MTTPTASVLNIPVVALLPLALVGCTDLPVGQAPDTIDDQSRGDDNDDAQSERDLGFSEDDMRDAIDAPDVRTPDALTPDAAGEPDTSAVPDATAEPDSAPSSDAQSDVHVPTADAGTGDALSDGAGTDVVEDVAVGLDAAADADTSIDLGSPDTTPPMDVGTDTVDDPAPYRPDPAPGTLFGDFLDALTPGRLQDFCEELDACGGPYDSVEECVGVQYDYAAYVLARTEFIYGYYAYLCGYALGAFYDCYYEHLLCGEDGEMGYEAGGEDCFDAYVLRYYACNPFY